MSAIDFLVVFSGVFLFAEEAQGSTLATPWDAASFRGVGDLSSLKSAESCSKTLLPDVTSTYGVDVSFPIHHMDAGDKGTSTGQYHSVGDQDEVFRQFMEGCRSHYGPYHADACDEGEELRRWKNLNQPSAVMNFTRDGYVKMKVPQQSFAELQEFWRANRPCFATERRAPFSGDVHSNDTWTGDGPICAVDKEGNFYENLIEPYDFGATNGNYWDVPTMFVEVEDESLVGGGSKLKNKLSRSIQQTVSHWVGGYDVRLSSCYGIRIYQKGSVLAPHVDYDDLIFGVIINIAQDEEHSDWPLEIYGHDGKARNITMSPGEMVLFESQSVIHGRPFPLKGRYYANLFLHFEPIGPNHFSPDNQTISNGYEKTLPFYLNEESDYGKWFLRNKNNDEEVGGKDDISPFQHVDDESCLDGCDGPLSLKEDAWRASFMGDLFALKALAHHNTALLSLSDDNGWRSLHYAASEGHVDVTTFILNNDVDVNALADENDVSSTPLSLAKMYFGDAHPVSKILVRHGATEYA